MPQAFPRPDGSIADKWESEVAELREVLSDEEYDAARRSTLDAHYTSQTVVTGIYDALERLGVEGSDIRVLEPSVGTGNFFGLLPDRLVKNTTLIGIELDPLTSGIAKLLYPEAKIHGPRGFQEVDFPDNYFDVAVGNPPFGDQKLFDAKRKNLSKFSIHNYFFAKSVATLRPGGVMGMVVSRYFMDSSNSAARVWIGERARLLGAIRLPNTAFKANAGTEVVTDLVFFQKLDEDNGITSNADEWVKTTAIDVGEEKINVNSYFAANPAMVLGKQDLTGSMYRDNEYTVEPTGDLAEQLKKAIAKLPEKAYLVDHPRAEVIGAQVDDKIPELTRVGGMFVAEDGSIRMRAPDSAGEQVSEPVNGLGNKQVERITGLLQIRDAVRTQIRNELDPSVSASKVKLSRKKLNTVYDRFVKKHGLIHSEGNRRIFRADPEWPLLLSLEDKYQKAITPAVAKKRKVKPRAAKAEKAAIFSRRVINPNRIIDKVATASDALAVALNEYGYVNIEHMARIYGKSEKEIGKELAGVIFRDPGGGWFTADEYLSGNVKRKLAEAKDAVNAGESEFEANVEALEKVQPKDVDAVDIFVKPGSPWVPGEVYSDFVKYLIDGTSSFEWVPQAGTWIVSISGANEAKNRNEWGTSRMSASEIIERLVTNKSIQVWTKDADDKRVIDQEKTTEANAKADEIKREFSDWIWESADRRQRVARLYNDKYNTDVDFRPDGSHLTFPGQVPDEIIKLNEHQVNAAWRAIREGRILFDHAVGSGKSFTAVAATMEAKRMGLIRKPMYVVPNHLIEQWAAEFYRLYPSANILAATKQDFEKNRRKELFSRIATGDWDAVIVAHSSFGKIPLDPEMEAAHYEKQLEEAKAAYDAFKANEATTRRSLKERERAIEKIKTRIEKAKDRRGKDDLLTLEEMGVDHLVVDEAHKFKNLPYISVRPASSGLSVAASQKAEHLFLATRSIADRNKGRGIYFLTGTPISNSIVEMYTMQRYLDMENLRDLGIDKFDAWLDTFANSTTGWELDSTGVRYALKTRFASFENMPELITHYRRFADAVSLKDLEERFEEMGKKWPQPKVKGGAPEIVVVPRSPQQAAYMQEIIKRAEHMPDDPREDNFLKLTHDARSAGLDMRLVDPSAPDYSNSKINIAAGRIHGIWEKWKKERGTQLVFIDLSTPKKARSGEQKRIQQLIAKSEEGDEKATEELEKMSPDTLRALRTDFDAYNDLKNKLIAKGIPENEIAFIHDANTDKQKAELFAKVNDGQVRVIFGSTEKLGAGTNVQHRLVGLHHLDAPWRPSDIEQREGRILRQGNELYAKDPDGFEVEILRYATEMTYDARMWQTIEIKANYIEAVRANATGRSMEDIGNEAANAAMMKAAASGNPLILEQVELDADVKKLEILKRSHQRKQFRVQDEIERISRDGGPTARAEKRIAKYQAYIDHRDANTPEKGYRLNGNDLEADDATALIEKEVKRAFTRGKEEQRKPVRMFNYRGFDVHLSTQEKISRGEGQEKVHEGWQFELTFDLPDGGVHYVGTYQGIEEIKPLGIATRINNVLKSFEGQIDSARNDAERQEKHLKDLKALDVGPFPQEEELKQKQARLAEVIKLLQKESSEGAAGISVEPAKSVDEFRHTHVMPDGTKIRVLRDNQRGDVYGYQMVQTEDGKEELHRYNDTNFELLRESKDDKIEYIDLREADEYRTDEEARRELEVAGQVRFDKFSMRAGEPVHGYTVSKVQKELNDAYGKRTIDRLIENGVLFIGETPGAYGERPGVQGVTYDKSPITGKEPTPAVALFASAIEPGTAPKVLVHEIGVHYGLEKMIGPKRFADVKRQVVMMAKAGNPQAKAAREFAKEHARKPEHVDEEALAYLIEHNQEMSLVKKIISYIRQFLYRIGFRVNLSPDDLTMMATAALRRASRQQPAGMGTPALAGATGRMFSVNTAVAGTVSRDPNLSSLVNKARGPAKKSALERWRDFKHDWRDRMMQGALDSFHGLKRAEQAAGIREQDMGYVQARTSRGLDTRLWVALVKGALHWRADGSTGYIRDSKGLLDVLAPVEDRLDLFNAYLVAKRARRLAREEREKFVTADEISAMDQYLRDNPDERRVFQAVERDWHTFNGHMLDFAVESGYLSRETADLWKNMADYVPFYRIFEEHVTAPGQGGGLQPGRIKALRGGSSPLNNIFDNMVRNTAFLIEASTKNRALLQSIENLEGTGIVERAPAKFRKTLVSMASVKKLLDDPSSQLSHVRDVLDAAGVKVEDLPRETWEGFAKMWSITQPTGPVVRLHVNGKPEWYYVNDPLLFQSLSSVNQIEFGKWMNVFRFPKRVLTTLVTIDPTFMLANWIRDTQQAFVLSKDSNVPIIGALRGMKETLARGDDFWEMMAAGGGFHAGFVRSQDREATAAIARKEMRHKDFQTSVLSTPQKLADWWSDFGSMFENANRMAIYQDARAAGKSHLMAAFESRDFLDFSMRGSHPVMAFLVESVPFLNARMQGIYRLGRGAHENPAAFMLKGSLIAAAALALWWFNHDDERYKQLTDYDKDLYFHFFIGDHHFRLPKGFEVGFLFGTTIERGMEAMFSKADDAGKLLIERMAWNAWQVFNLGEIRPQLISPIVEQMANMDFFRQVPIENQREQNLLPADRYNEWTHETAIAIGRATNLSPARIDHLMRAYGGSVGDYLLTMADYGVRAIGDYPEPPALRWDQVPLVQRFYREDSPPKVTRYQEEFYDLSEKANQAWNSYRNAVRSANGDRGQEILDDYRNELAARRHLSSARQKVSIINKRMRATYLDKSLSPEQKLERRNEMLRRKQEIQKQTVKEVKGLFARSREQKAQAQ